MGALLALLLIAGVSAQPFAPGTGFIPLGAPQHLFDLPWQRMSLQCGAMTGVLCGVMVLQVARWVRGVLRSVCSLSCSGNLRTSDFGGPYNFSLLTVQENEIKGERVVGP